MSGHYQAWPGHVGMYPAGSGAYLSDPLGPYTHTPWHSSRQKTYMCAVPFQGANIDLESEYVNTLSPQNSLTRKSNEGAWVSKTRNSGTFHEPSQSLLLRTSTGYHPYPEHTHIPKPKALGPPEKPQERYISTGGRALNLPKPDEHAHLEKLKSLEHQIQTMRKEMKTHKDVIVSESRWMGALNRVEKKLDSLESKLDEVVEKLHTQNPPEGKMARDKQNMHTHKTRRAKDGLPKGDSKAENIDKSVVNLLKKESQGVLQGCVHEPCVFGEKCRSLSSSLTSVSTHTEWMESDVTEKPFSSRVLATKGPLEENVYEKIQPHESSPPQPYENDQGDSNQAVSNTHTKHEYVHPDVHEDKQTHLRPIKSDQGTTKMPEAPQYKAVTPYTSQNYKMAHVGQNGMLEEEKGSKLYDEERQFEDVRESAINEKKSAHRDVEREAKSAEKNCTPPHTQHYKEPQAVENVCAHTEGYKGEVYKGQDYTHFSGSLNSLFPSQSENDTHINPKGELNKPTEFPKHLHTPNHTHTPITHTPIHTHTPSHTHTSNHTHTPNHTHTEPMESSQKMKCNQRLEWNIDHFSQALKALMKSKSSSLWSPVFSYAELDGFQLELFLNFSKSNSATEFRYPTTADLYAWCCSPQNLKIKLFINSQEQIVNLMASVNGKRNSTMECCSANIWKEYNAVEDCLRVGIEDLNF